MIGFRGHLAATTAAAALLVAGSLVSAAPEVQAQGTGMPGSGSSVSEPYRGGTGAVPRTAEEAAEKGARVSRPIPGIPGIPGSSQAPAATTGSGMSSSGSMSSGSSASYRGMDRMSRSEVMSLQRALNAEGANLQVDGKIGPRTRSALMDYQSRNGLTASGHADSATRAKLGI